MIEKITVLPESVFIDHAYVQHDGAEWRAKHYFCHHIYMILDDAQLKGPIALPLAIIPQ